MSYSLIYAPYSLIYVPYSLIYVPFSLESRTGLATCMAVAATSDSQRARAYITRIYHLAVIYSHMYHTNISLDCDIFAQEREGPRNLTAG